MNAPFAWPGGKRNLIKTLLPKLPPHKLYVEVFAGSAKLLFAKPLSDAEVINDINGDVTNFFRIVKHRPAELAEMFEHELLHPERFRELRQVQDADELGRAFRFAYTTWYSFGAKGEHFAAANLNDILRGGVRRPLDTIRDLLEQASRRLQRVRVEQRDFGALIARFDSPETFFYLDPPYVHFSDIARYDALSEQRRKELFTSLSSARGAFLMSFDDCREVRTLAKEHGFHIEEVSTSYSLGAKNRKQVTELLVSRCAREVVDVDAAGVGKKRSKLR